MPTPRFTRDAWAYLKAMQPKPCRQVALKILELARDPRPPDSKPLRGAEDMRRADAGEFRIIYRVEGDELEILVIGKRNDDEVYRKSSRRR